MRTNLLTGVSFLRTKLMMSLFVAVVVMAGSSMTAGAAGGCTVTNGRIQVAINSTCNSIQAAVNAAPGTAASPVVIDVLPGTYIVSDATNSAVDFTNKGYIHLRGSGRDLTIVTGANTVGFHVRTATNVEISEISYIGKLNGGPGACIGAWINGSSNVRLIDTVIANTNLSNGASACEGIGVNNSSNVFISNNFSTGHNKGFTVWNGNTNVTVTNNKFTGNNPLGFSYYGDIVLQSLGANVSYNIFDTVGDARGAAGSYNVYSNGNPRPLP